MRYVVRWQLERPQRVQFSKAWRADDRITPVIRWQHRTVDRLRHQCELARKPPPEHDYSRIMDLSELSTSDQMPRPLYLRILIYKRETSCVFAKRSIMQLNSFRVFDRLGCKRFSAGFVRAMTSEANLTYVQGASSRARIAEERCTARITINSLVHHRWCCSRKSDPS